MSLYSSLFASKLISPTRVYNPTTSSVLVFLFKFSRHPTNYQVSRNLLKTTNQNFLLPTNKHSPRHRSCTYPTTEDAAGYSLRGRFPEGIILVVLLQRGGISCISYSTRRMLISNPSSARKQRSQQVTRWTWRNAPVGTRNVISAK